MSRRQDLTAYRMVLFAAIRAVPSLRDHLPIVADFSVAGGRRLWLTHETTRGRQLTPRPLAAMVYPEAVRLQAASARESAASVIPADQEESNAMLQRSREALGAAAFDLEWRTGRAMPLPEAIAYALELIDD